jgi:N-6 DNA Methylase
MTTEHVRNQSITELPLSELYQLAPDLHWKYLPIISPALSPVEICQAIGEWYRACTTDIRRQNAGQFFTPPAIAHYMASIAGELRNEMHILDPGAGVGMLTSAICEETLRQKLSTISITAYESDPILHVLCLWTLNYIRDILYKHDLTVSITVHPYDFVEAQESLSYEEAIGLASFLNSSLVDRYFRIISGNTQVSATELKKLPLPPWKQIIRIGEQVVQAQVEQDSEATELIIMNVLGQDLIFNVGVRFIIPCSTTM